MIAGWVHGDTLILISGLLIEVEEELLTATFIRILFNLYFLKFQLISDALELSLKTF